MAWGLEARVPLLDKAFLEVAMNIDAKEKMFTKGLNQEVDEDGRPKMEKVSSLAEFPALWFFYSTSFGRHLIVRQRGRSVDPDNFQNPYSPTNFRHISQTLFYGAKRNSSQTVSDILG